MVKIEIKEKKENQLAGRLEVRGKITFEGATPSNQVFIDKLAVELNKAKDLIVTRYIRPRYSYREAEFLAFVYNNPEKKKQMEVSTKHLRKKAEAEKKKAAEESAKKAEAVKAAVDNQE